MRFYLEICRNFVIRRAATQLTSRTAVIICIILHLYLENLLFVLQSIARSQTLGSTCAWPILQLVFVFSRDFRQRSICRLLPRPIVCLHQAWSAGWVCAQAGEASDLSIVFSAFFVCLQLHAARSILNPTLNVHEHVCLMCVCAHNRSEACGEVFFSVFGLMTSTFQWRTAKGLTVGLQRL